MPSKSESATEAVAATNRCANDSKLQTMTNVITYAAMPSDKFIP